MKKIFALTLFLLLANIGFANTEETKETVEPKCVHPDTGDLYPLGATIERLGHTLTCQRLPYAPSKASFI